MLITLVTDPFIDSNKIDNGVYQITTISQVDFLLNQMNGGGGGENCHFIDSIHFNLTKKHKFKKSKSKKQT
jgi:hypothetical protein